MSEVENKSKETGKTNQSIDELKKQGNEEFSSRNYQKALDLYTSALEKLGENEEKETRSVLLSNCSACFFRLKKFNEAVFAADESLKSNPLFTKACNRKALALKALLKPFEALECYKKFVVKLEEHLNSLKTDETPQEDTEDDKQQRKYFIDKSEGADKVVFLSEGEKGELQKDISYIKTRINELESACSKLTGAEKLKAYISKSEFPTLLKGPDGAKPTQSMFELLECIGEGNYSQIFRVKFKLTNEIFAMKVIDKKKVEKMSRRHKNIYNEIRLEKFMMHKRFSKFGNDLNITKTAKLVCSFQNNSSIFFIYELSEKGEVWDLLRYTNKFNKRDKDLEFLMVGVRPSLVKFLLAQLVNAMEFFKTCNYVHRDIKPENMLLTGKDLHTAKTEEELVKLTLADNQEQVINSTLLYMKLIDFGTGLDLLDEEEEINSKQYFVGTPEYMSYEALKSQKPTHALDIWSFGCTAYQLYTGLIPFRAGSPYYCYLRSKKLSYFIPDTLPLDLLSLLRGIFLRNPENRLTLEQIKAHKYFTGVDFEKLNTQPFEPMPTLLELCVAKIGETICNVKYKKMKNSSYIERKFRKIGVPYHANMNNYVFSDNHLTKKDQNFLVKVNNRSLQLNFKTNFVTYHNKQECLQICNKNILKSGYAVKVLKIFEEAKESQSLVIPSAVNVGRLIKDYIKQRGMLKFPPVSSLFYDRRDTLFRFTRPINNFYQGYDRHNNLKFKGNFNILYVPNITMLDPTTNPQHGEILKAVVSQINSIKEFKPHMILFTDGLQNKEQDIVKWGSRVDSIQSILKEVDLVYPMAFAPSLVTESSLAHYEAKYGSSYYSMFLQGNKVVVVDSCLLQHVPEDFITYWKKTTQKPKEKKEEKKEVESVKEEQEEGDVDSDAESFKTEDSEPLQAEEFDVETITKDMEIVYDFDKDSERVKQAIRHFVWLENEMFSAKFEGRHLIVLSYHSWCKPEGVEPETVLAQHVVDYFLPRIRHSCGQIILTSNNRANKLDNLVMKEGEVGMFNIKLQHLFTKQFLEDSVDTGTLRVLKVMSTNVKSEQYKVSDLPKYLVMPEDHYVEDEVDKDSESSFSTSSFDSSDDSDSDSD